MPASSAPCFRKRLAPRTRKARRKRLLYYGISGVLLFIGVLGIVLPILHGILFLVAALILLSRVSPRVRLFRLRARRRYPKFARKYDEVETAAEERLARILARLGLR